MDIVEQLHFDAARCELEFSKGIAENIEEAAAEITRLRSTMERMRGSMLTAKVLIGAVNDTATPAVKESNINQAWHFLDGCLSLTYIK